MDEKNIMENEAALKILTDARNALESIGVHCSLAPLSLPQGMSISLHVAETGIAAVAANVALTTGGMAAHTIDTNKQFENEVAYALADDILIKAAYKKL